MAIEHRITTIASTEGEYSLEAVSGPFVVSRPWPREVGRLSREKDLKCRGVVETLRVRPH